MRMRPFFLSASAALWLLIAPGPLRAQMGWTKAQVEKKFGHSFKDVDDEVKYALPAAKFPELHAGGFNRIKFGYFQGKVVRLDMSWTPELPAKMAKGLSGEEKEQIIGAYDAAHKGRMSYETAKKFALTFIEPNPDATAIEREEHASPQAAPPQDSGTFIYKGWRFRWAANEYSGGVREQEFSLAPAQDTSSGKTYGTRDNQ